MKTIGVIGLGSIGLRHAKNLIAMGHRVIGYDPDTSRDHALLIAGGEISDNAVIKGLDAVVIASPSAKHASQLEAYMHLKVPCLVEKPITLANPGVVESTLKYAAERGTPVMVGHNLRFHPLVIGAKRWTSSHTPSVATFIVAQKSTKPEYLRDGLALNWAVHEIDLALYLLGPATVANARGNNLNLKAVLKHDSGCISNIYADYIRDPEQREFHLADNTNEMHADLVSPAEVWDQVYKDEMSWFLDSIDQEVVAGTPYYGASGEEGLEAVKIALEVNRVAGL